LKLFEVALLGTAEKCSRNDLKLELGITKEKVFTNISYFKK
jgi:hypothetical protein